jgi:signal transduction histidine kinase
MPFFKTRSIIRLITLNLIAIITVASLAIILTDFYLQKQRVFKLLEERADEYAGYLVQSLEWPLWTLDQTAMQLISQAYINNDYVASITISDTERDYIVLHKTDTQPLLRRTAPILHNGQNIGKVEMGLSARSREEQLKRVLLSSLVNLLGILLVLALFSHILLRYALKHPLNQFMTIIRTAAEGQYQFDGKIPDHVELKEIFASFTHMAHQISDREESLRQSAHQLKNEIEARKQSEIEREKLIQELESRNAELERFTYTISHDLKSPLITIKGFLGYVRKAAAAGDWPRAEGDLNRISEAADRMNRLLAELLDLTRIGRIEVQHESFGFRESAQDVCRAMAPHLTEQKVQVVIGEGDARIYGDRRRIREVIENLVDNAVKFMGPQPDARIELGTLRRNGNTLFYVRDNGIGIEKAYQQRIFNMFERLDPTIDGTGIGLAIVKRVVEVHGGKVWIESEGSGTGSTFYFTLPESSPAAT